MFAGIQLARSHVFRRHASSLHRIPAARSFATSVPRNIQYVRFSNSRRPLIKSDAGVKVVVGAAGLGLAYYVAHLEQVPDTGRWRFMNTSPRYEAQIGELARQQSREEFKQDALPVNHPISRHVRRVVTRILAASHLGNITGDALQHKIISDGDVWNPDTSFGGAAAEVPTGPEKEWDVIVVNNPKMINAQAVPGLIVVYTGILPICQDEQGLAAVLAHEIGHVVARHTAERISSQTVFIAFAVLLQALGMDFGISNIVQKLFLELPNSRTQEREADMIGLRLMSRACYNPQAAPEMFNRLAQVESKLSKRVNMDFFQTHPSSESRVKYLETALPEGYAILAANPECGGMQEQLQAFQQAAGARGGSSSGSDVFVDS